MFEGFKKVAQSGGSYVVATFYNVLTGETKTACVRDYDYSDCSRDNDELYNMPIDEEVRRLWLHSQGHILEGDTVEVVKGRKVKIGTVGKVTGKRDIKDRYGRLVAVYVILDTGESTNVANCILRGIY